MSIKREEHNKISDVPVTQHHDQVIAQNTSNVVDIASLVDHVIASRGVPKTIHNSIHAPKAQSIVNLPPKDLHHHLNALHHKPSTEQPGFLLFTASSIPRYNRLNKLNFIRELSQTLPGFLDLNWLYHDQSAAIIIEYVN